MKLEPRIRQDSEGLSSRIWERPAQVAGPFWLSGFFGVDLLQAFQAWCDHRELPVLVTQRIKDSSYVERQRQTARGLKRLLDIVIELHFQKYLTTLALLAYATAITLARSAGHLCHATSIAS